MATDAALVGDEPIGEGRGLVASRRNTAGLVGQYTVLIVLAVIVLLPIIFTVIFALSQPLRYASVSNEGGTLQKIANRFHPVEVVWKDRTWWSGGPFSVVVRTLLVALALAWVQLRATGTWVVRKLAEPRRLVAVVGGTVVFGLLTSPLFGSLHAADGKSALWVLAVLAAVAATQAVGLWAPDRVGWKVGLLALLVALGLVAVGVIATGAAAWTSAWTSADLGPAMVRSLVMTVLITALQVVTSVFSAYAFAFLRFPLKRLLFVLFMATLLLPLEVTLAGNIATIRELNWNNSNAALVLPFAATALGTFLLTQGFRGVPPEIRDATRLDGYGHLAFLWRFAVPLTRPVVASFTVISALSAWNQYLWPRAVIDTDSANTLQIQLRTLSVQNAGNANLTIAGALIAALPVVLLLIVFQRQIIRGLTAGAVK